MEQKKEQGMIPIWFIIGINILVYGITILAVGLINWSHPPQNVHLADKHADAWWGAFMLVLGVFYTIRFRPGAHTGMDDPPADHIAEKGTKWN